MQSSAAIPLEGQKLWHSQKLTPADDRTLAEEFKGVVLQFSVGQLARAAQCSKDTAKAWKAGRAVPSAGKLFRMAQTLGPVHDWVAGHIDPSKKLNAQIAQLQQQALMGGEEGAVARAKLAAITAAARGE